MNSVVAFGAWDRGPGYPRGDALLAGLRHHGRRVTECRFELPYQGIGKQRLLRSPWLWPGYWWGLRRMRRAATQALTAAIAAANPDVVLVPYPGHLLVSWVREVWDGPLVLDLFLSSYDTAVVDRQMFRPGSTIARHLWRMDRRACTVADRVLVDTPLNAIHMASLLGLPRNRFHPVPVAATGEPAVALPFSPPRPGHRLELLFFGTGVPLHGLGVLLDAVEQAPEVRLTLVGGTPADRDRAVRMGADRVRLLAPFVSPAELERELAAAHAVAGVFGTSAKADRVVPFKVMHALAAGRPVVTSRTRAVCAELREGVDAVLVPPGDGIALAAALRRMATQPEELASLAVAARRVFERQFSIARSGGWVVSACDCRPLTPPRRRVEPAMAAVT